MPRKRKDGVPPAFKRFSNPVQRPDGKWVSSAWLPDSKGKPRRRWKTAASESELIAKVKRVEADLGVVGAEGLLGTEEISEYRQAKRLAGDRSLVEIAQFWLDRQPKAGELTLKEAADAYRREVLSNHGEKTRQEHGRQLKLLETCLGSMHLSTITRDDVQHWFDAIPTATNANNHLRTAGTFLR